MVPNPKNPRKWKNDSEIRNLAESIRKNPDFFEARPILLSDRTGVLMIIGGERRWEAARHLGLTQAPSYLFHNLTEEREDEIMNRDNVHSGVWDEAKLQSWNKEQLQSWGVDGVKWPKQEQKIKEDNFNPDKKIAPRCKSGDLWELGKHRLLCGDSTNPETFSQLMQGKEARLCVTSPPYGVGKSYEEKGINPWKKTIFSVIDNITKHARIIVWNIGDLFATGTQFIEPTSMFSTQRFIENGYPLMYARIWKKQGGNFASTEPYYTVSTKPVQEYEWLLCYGKGDYEKDYDPIIKWLNGQALKADLNNSVLKEITGAGFMFGHWFTSNQWAMIDKINYEKIVAYCNSKSIKAFERNYEDLRREYENLNIYGKILSKEEQSAWGQWAIWEIATVNKRTYGHPAEFPIELPARFIKMHTRPGDTILEPFCGAGTTLIASEQLGRICFGVELDPHYCDVIISRWEQFTGKKAKKIN